MFDKIKSLVAKAKDSIAEASDSNVLADVKVRFLGRNGEYTGILRGLKDASPEDRPTLGKLINEGRAQIEEMFKEKEAQLKAREQKLKLAAERIDVTLPAKSELGSIHPLTLVKNQIVDIFIGLGFEVKEGPEIETDLFNFQLLNIPEDHPARDMQDTFYVGNNLLLRTHTSPMQAHTMKSERPPIRILVPGKVYRSDDDATHSPIFNQIEGLVIDKGVSLSHLKGTLEIFAKSLFGEETKVRFRPSYFPFTEPSVEVDVSCAMCGGKGCSLCKGTGWIEILGAGVVNPQVLVNCGIDPEVYSGFAFGFGVDRIAMIKYGIPNIRALYENDVRFLKQYK
ncbi:MAG: phenylalanine--tRNA ligase subunit alpha [Clostridia bacterium]|nr:phenylalanine--tRNA ligase subunit alpha [Clostridia bacterium]